VIAVPAGDRGGAADLAIVVPARNEAARLPALLLSLRDAGATPAEVIVADDHSTDDTAQVARAHGATVVPVPAAPAGWQGKTFACATGAAASRAARLLFLDADLRFERGGLARMLEATPPGVVASWCPHHGVRSPYEWLSLHFNVLMVAGTMARRGALFGQSLLITREAYDAIGGHGTVRGEVLEHHALGLRLRALGMPTQARVGRGVLSMRMYPEGLRALVGGWTKSFAAGAASSPPAVLLASVLWFSAGFSAVGALVTGIVTRGEVSLAVAAAYAMNVAVTHWAASRVGTYPLVASVLYPIPLLFCVAVFTVGAVRRAIGAPARWKGRDFGSAAQ
jgi:4,4'-diaponeurosporenoate glycosyltransferase